MRLSARGLTKHYGGVTVLCDVDMDVAPGEVRALVGENGAGKSTLIKILSGALMPDRGNVWLDGEALPAGRPQTVRDRGLSVVYQELTLVPDLTVAENIFLGRERGRPFLQRAEMSRIAAGLMAELGVPLDVRQAAGGLSVAHQQMVEIARALVTSARVIVFDEPSAALSVHEVDTLLAVVARLKARGLAVVYVSHRLDEIFRIADTVTVLRDGRHVRTAPAAAVTRDSLIREMVGREVAEEFPDRPSAQGPVVLSVRNLSAPPRFSHVSVDVCRGEIVGVAGLVGAGRTSAALALVGAIAAKGDVTLDGRPAKFRSPAEAIAGGLAYVTEDRKGRGIFSMLGVGDNITISHLGLFGRFGTMAPGRVRAGAEESARRFDVRMSDIDQPAGTLSGGNQQKALVARYLLRPPRVIILDEPTRGVDVGARAEIYRVMNDLTQAGLGILMISSDLPEVLGISDRIVVMREGRTLGAMTRAEASAERVMALAAPA
jgi:ribose transport system ATP-binding protein